MKTILHHYYFNINNLNQAEAWSELRNRLSGDKRYYCLEVLAEPSKTTFGNKSEEVELETKHLFSNQRNTKDGRRVFDWYLAVFPNRGVKQGHYLEITQEMEDIRNHTYKCGYCGAEYLDPEQVFCDKCLGNEYLHEDDLCLLRLRPVANHNPKYPQLTEAEAAWLRPAYLKAQGLGKVTREEAARSLLRKKVAALVPEAEAKAARLVVNARLQEEAFTWLLDREFREIDNVIHYDHTRVFCFGWRRQLSNEEKEELKKLLEDFPFKWEFHKG